MSSFNHCRDSGGYVAGAGGSMGGHRHSANNYTKCPTCGKRVRVTKGGRLWPHGTRKPVTNQPTTKENTNS